MKIVVLVKQVPNTSDFKINKETNTLIRSGVESICNPDDLAGVEEALKLKDIYGGEVTTVTMGPLQAKDMILELYARGVDNAVLLSDRKFAGSDTLATSKIISSYLKTIDYDLIIAGYQAIDGDTAQVGPQIAELLDIPQVTHLSEIKKIDDGEIYVSKRYENRVEDLKVKMPLLITTLKDMNLPRYMNAFSISEISSKEIKIITRDDIEVKDEEIGLLGSPTRVKKSFPKKIEPKSEKEFLSPSEAAKKIADLVAK